MKGLFVMNGIKKAVVAGVVALMSVIGVTAVSGSPAGIALADRGTGCC